MGDGAAGSVASDAEVVAELDAASTGSSTAAGSVDSGPVGQQVFLLRQLKALNDIAGKSSSSKEKRREAKGVLEAVAVKVEAEAEAGTGNDNVAKQCRTFHHMVFEHSLRVGSPLAFLHDTDNTRFQVRIGEIDVPTSGTFYDFTRRVCGEASVSRASFGSRSKLGAATSASALSAVGCAQEYQVAATGFSTGLHGMMPNCGGGSILVS